MRITLNSTVKLVDCCFPDGEDVTGVWTVIGRKGEVLTLERQGTIISVPEHDVVIDKLQIEPDSITLAPGAKKRCKDTKEYEVLS